VMITILQVGTVIEHVLFTRQPELVIRNEGLI
jgi:hypothetical protein